MNQTDATKIALIGKDISFINENIKEIKETMNQLSGVYVPTTIYQEEKKAQNLRILRLESSSNLWRWLSPTLSAIFGSIITILIISYLNNLHG